VQNDYDIFLDIGTLGIQIQSNVMGVTYSIDPYPNGIFGTGATNTTFNINYTVFDQASDLSGWGMNIIAPNGTQIWTGNSAVAAGGNMTAYFNISGATLGQIITAQAYFTKTGHPQEVITKEYYIVSAASGTYSLWGVLGTATGNVGGFGGALIALIITGIITASSGMFLGFSRVLIVVPISSLALFAYIGWLGAAGWGIVAAISITGVALIIASR